LIGTQRGGAERPVEPADETLELAAESLVRLHVRARWDRHLDEPHALGQVRVAADQLLEGEEAARDALRVVEPVDAEDQRTALRPGAQRLRLGDDGGLLRRRREALGIDAHREGPEPDLPRADADTVALGRDAEHAQERRREVAQVRRRVKADEVRAEESLENLLAERQRAEHLGGGKRNVEEVADADFGNALAQELRHQHELIVVHPHDVAGTMVLRDDVGEVAVRALVRGPALHVDRQLVEKVVEGRPQDRVAESLVEALRLVGPEPHGNGAHGRQPVFDVGTLGRADIARIARPPIQSPSPRSCGPVSPVARPPVLRATSSRPSFCVTVIGRRFETISSRDMRATRTFHGPRRRGTPRC
jgi:hypothetical protein